MLAITLYWCGHDREKDDINVGGKSLKLKRPNRGRPPREAATKRPAVEKNNPQKSNRSNMSLDLGIQAAVDGWPDEEEVCVTPSQHRAFHKVIEIAHKMNVPKQRYKAKSE